MTVTKSAEDVAATGQWAGPPPVAPRLALPRNRRRTGVMAAAVVLVLLGGLGAWWAVRQSTATVTVVGLARDVWYGEDLTAQDLVQVDVAPVPGVSVVLWSSVGSVVGKPAATDLLRGSLLTPRSLLDAAVIAADESVVGVTVKPAQAPAMELHPRDQVLVVLIPSAAEAGEVSWDSSFAGVEAWVLSVGEVQSGGARTVDVVVPAEKAAAVAGLAAAGRLAIVFVSRG